MGISMEKAIDFCFRTGGTAGSVVTTQIAIVRPMPPSGISSAYLSNANAPHCLAVASEGTRPQGRGVPKLQKMYIFYISRKIYSEYAAKIIKISLFEFFEFSHFGIVAELVVDMPIKQSDG